MVGTDRDGRPDPRIERTREVVRDAVLDELADVGYVGFTVESVAARAGVGKSTIYRHWDGRLELVVDTLDHRVDQPRVDRPGSPRELVRALLVHLVESMRDPVLSPVVPALAEAAERDAQIASRFHAGNDVRRRALVEAIAATVEEGDATAGPDPELAALLLAGGVVYARLMTDRPVAAEQVDALLDMVLGPVSPDDADGPSSPRGAAP